MLLVAVPTKSYEYIKMMRWAVFLIFSLSAIIAWHSKRMLAVALHLAIAVVFNPIASLHFQRDVWVILDAIAASLSLLIAWFSRQQTPTALERESTGDMLGFVIGLAALVAGVIAGMFLAKILGLGSFAEGLLAFATSSAALYAAILTFHHLRMKK